MKIMGLGIDYKTGELLVKPMDSTIFAEKLWESLNKKSEDFTKLANIGSHTVMFRGEVARKTTDLGNPREAGWTYIVNAKDPDKDEIIKILRPLAEYRGMKNPESPLVFNGEAEDDWFDWLQENYYSVERLDRPYYITLVGGPDKIPFRLQSLLDMAASVGRLDFDSLDDLKAYVDKVIRLETISEPTVDRKALVFAPDYGPDDPTHFSRLYMAEPLAEHICDNCQCATTIIVGDEAKKSNLAAALLNDRPALVYTASHGLGAAGQSLDIQKKFNGGICCQRNAGEPMEKWLFTAADVPLDKPFLEGSVFFQFACFGYGTPAESDYSHWLDKPELNCEQDFVAALPKKLLSHPRGPIAFVGHVDTAFLQGFDDPENPYPIGKWHDRMSPFVAAVNDLLDTQPVGMTMTEMNERYGIGNAQISSFLDQVQRGKKDFKEYMNWLVDKFIIRSDAQNYMIFGDPAVRIRLPCSE
jgi:hypothetical protein